MKKTSSSLASLLAMPIRYFRIVLLSTAVILSVTLSSLGQAPTGSILGTVQDESKAFLPGVTVTARNTETNQTRVVLSNEMGSYRLAQLPLGTYEVQAELTGFRTEVRGPITITIGREAVVEFSLKVGALSEKVIVSGEAPIVETTSATVSGLVDDKKIRDLPLNGRDFAQLALLQEGVVKTGIAGTQAGNEGVKVSIGGTRFHQTAFLLDGSDIRNQTGAMPAGATGMVAGVETVKEFKVITGAYSAEYGQFTGGVITAVTKSGTNEFHGSLFEFLRNSALDSRNFFDRDNQRPTVRSSPPPFVRNQFGFSAGGPVVRDRTFFFGSYEGLRQRLHNTTIYNVPTAAARQGLLPSGPVAVAAVIKPYLDLYPLPNGPDLGGGAAQFFRSNAFPVNQDLMTVRVDHQFSPGNSIFGRYTLDRSDRSAAESLVTSQSFIYRYQYLTLSEKAIFSPNLINEARLGVIRTTNVQQPEETVPIDPSLRFSRQTPPLLGQMTTSGLSPLGAFLERFHYPTFFQYSDDLAYTRGRHFMKIGFNATRFDTNERLGVRVHGVFNFSNISSLLRATPLRFDGFQTPPYMAGMRQSLFGLYFQDDLKATARLTFNLGLRYEFITSPVEVSGRISNLERVTDASLKVGNPYFKNPSLRNFSPRVGFAWDIQGDARTSLRGGMGIFYDQLLPYLYDGSPVFNPPFALRAAASNPNFPDPFARGVPAVAALWAMGEPKQPYIMQYSLDLQRQVAANLVLSLSYHGSQGRKLGRLVNDANLAIPQTVNGRIFFPANASRRNPVYSGIRMEFWDASSFYNSMRLGLNKRFSGGLQFQAVYNWSRFVEDSTGVGHFDGGGNVSPSPLPDDHRSGRSLSSSNASHTFALNFTYDLPGSGSGSRLVKLLSSGWQVNGIVSAATGPPATLTISFDRARSLQFELAQYPDLRPGASNNPVIGDGRDPNHYYDPGAFAVPPEGFFGNLGRNTLIAPGVLTVDFGIVRSIRLAEVASLQFRAEGFNILNRANFGVPGLSVFSDAQGTVTPTAGVISQTTTTSRQIQFALKVLF